MLSKTKILTSILTSHAARQSVKCIQLRLFSSPVFDTRRTEIRRGVMYYYWVLLYQVIPSTNRNRSLVTSRRNNILCSRLFLILYKFLNGRMPRQYLFSYLNTFVHY